MQKLDSFKKFWGKDIITIMIALFMTIANLPVYAQRTAAKNVTGTVANSSSGNLLIGVSVQIKGTHTGIITDAKGHYKIEAPENAMLVFSYVFRG